MGSIIGKKGEIVNRFREEVSAYLVLNLLEDVNQIDGEQIEANWKFTKV